MCVSLLGRSLSGPCDWLGMFSMRCDKTTMIQSAVWLKSPALLILIVSCVCMCYVVLFVSGPLIGVYAVGPWEYSLSEAWARVYNY